MFWKKKPPTYSGFEEKCGHAVYEVLAAGVSIDGRIRVEDFIAAAASVVAEICIEAAGNYNPRKHQFVPGSRVLSDKVNEIFAGNTVDLNKVPGESVVGTLRDYLLAAGYSKADFPSLQAIFENFAKSVGAPGDWGKVAWSVPEDHRPFILPLQVAYETRASVDRAFVPLVNPTQRLRAATLTLAEVLIRVEESIDKKVALLLALETINGMAKTAPMTDEAMAAANQKGGL